VKARQPWFRGEPMRPGDRVWVLLPLRYPPEPEPITAEIVKADARQEHVTVRLVGEGFRGNLAVVGWDKVRLLPEG